MLVWRKDVERKRRIFWIEFLEMCFVSERFIPEAILRMESVTRWRRNWEGSQSLIWCEGVLNVNLRKQLLKHGGARWQKSTTENYCMVRGTRCKEKAPSQFVLFMVWHDSIRLGKATVEREVGIWVEIEIVVKIWEHYKKVCSLFGLRSVPKEDSKGQSNNMDNFSSMILDEKRTVVTSHLKVQ